MLIIYDRRLNIKYWKTIYMTLNFSIPKIFWNIGNIGLTQTVCVECIIHSIHSYRILIIRDIQILSIPFLRIFRAHLLFFFSCEENFTFCVFNIILDFHYLSIMLTDFRVVIFSKCMHRILRRIMLTFVTRKKVI